MICAGDRLKSANSATHTRLRTCREVLVIKLDLLRAADLALHFRWCIGLVQDWEAPGRRSLCRCVIARMPKVVARNDCNDATTSHNHLRARRLRSLHRDVQRPDPDAIRSGRCNDPAHNGHGTDATPCRRFAKRTGPPFCHWLGAHHNSAGDTYLKTYRTDVPRMQSGSLRPGSLSQRPRRLDRGLHLIRADVVEQVQRARDPGHTLSRHMVDHGRFHAIVSQNDPAFKGRR